jgi:regulator of RNase E activity RraA
MSYGAEPREAREPAWSRVMVDRLRELDTCAVSDALDLLGLTGVVLGPRRLWPVPSVVAGLVRTIQAGPRRDGVAAGHIAAAAVDDSGPEDVLVIANGGRTDVSCWGGILSVAAARRRIAGVVIDGACRDIAESEAVEFPVFALRTVPTSARGRIVQLEMDCVVEIEGVEVSPGDYVVADATGVAFIPGSRLEDVLTAAERVAQREAAMVRSVQQARPVADVMHDTQFPTIETR